ncbi:MAG: hypothetical protein KGM96_12360 [Acidobacteriota bacterium]|jgi:hypothetical protein|nr:hypothetical protein [Acidobacteriota bacterium]
MKSEIFERLLGELMDDLSDSETAAAVAAGEYGYRLYLNGADEFVLVGDAYFARDVPDQACEMAFRDWHGDCHAGLSLRAADRIAAREALEIAAHAVEIRAEEMKA